MVGMIVLVVGILILWLLAFFTKRRFGVLGLALASGALLSMLWSQELVGIIEKMNISLASISTAGFVAVALVLAPAILLLFSGPSYRNKHGRVMGATLFAIFAGVLIAEPLRSALVLDGVGQVIFDSVVRYKVYLVTAGVIVALLDVLAIHTVGGGHGKGKH